METWLDILKRLIAAHNKKNPKYEVYLAETDFELVIQFKAQKGHSLRRKISQNDIGGTYEAAEWIALHLFSRGIMQPI